MSVPYLVIMSVVACLLNGVSLRFLWGWFVVPAFDLPAISLVTAIGIAIIVSLLTGHYIERNPREARRAIMFDCFAPIFYLIIGWIVHSLA